MSTGEGHGPDCGDEAGGCHEALQDLERYLDGELPAGELSRIQLHLNACYPCTERASFEEQVRAIVRQGCSDQAPSSLVSRIRSRLDAGELPI